MSSPKELLLLYQTKLRYLESFVTALHMLSLEVNNLTLLDEMNKEATKAATEIAEQEVERETEPKQVSEYSEKLKAEFMDWVKEENLADKIKTFEDLRFYFNEFRNSRPYVTNNIYRIQKPEVRPMFEQYKDLLKRFRDNGEVTFSAMGRNTSVALSLLTRLRFNHNDKIEWDSEISAKIFADEDYNTDSNFESLMSGEGGFFEKAREISDKVKFVPTLVLTVRPLKEE